MKNETTTTFTAKNIMQIGAVVNIFYLHLRLFVGPFGEDCENCVESTKYF